MALVRKHQQVMAWLKQGKKKRMSIKKLREKVGAGFVRSVLRGRGRGVCKRRLKKTMAKVAVTHRAKDVLKGRSKVHGFVAEAIRGCAVDGVVLPSRRTCERQCTLLRSEAQKKRAAKTRNTPKATNQRTVCFFPEFFIKNNKVRTEHTQVMWDSACSP